MAHLEVLIWPDPELIKPSEPVAEIDASILQLVEDMKETMVSRGDAVGLAAPQVGVRKRITVINFADFEENAKEMYDLRAVINPVFLNQEGRMDFEEACLSIPGDSGVVRRFSHVTVQFLDIEGVEHTLELAGYPAVVFQHECDHLDGKLWIDYQGPLKKKLVLKKMNKIRASLR